MIGIMILSNIMEKKELLSLVGSSMFINYDEEKINLRRKMIDEEKEKRRLRIQRTINEQDEEKLAEDMFAKKDYMATIENKIDKIIEEKTSSIFEREVESNKDLNNKEFKTIELTGDKKDV